MGRYIDKKLKFIKIPNNKRALRKLSKHWKDRLELGNGWKTLEMRRLIARARKYVGYSPKTVDYDIVSNLYKTSKQYESSR